MQVNTISPTRILANGVDVQGDLPDDSVLAGSIALAANGDNGTLNMNTTALTSLLSGARQKGYEPFAVSMALVFKQAKTIPSSALRGDVFYCTPMERLADHVVSILPGNLDQQSFFWQNQSPLNRAGLIKFFCENSVNPKECAELRTLVNPTRGIFPLQRTDNGTLNGQYMDDTYRTDEVLGRGYWNMDEGLQVCMQNTGAAVIEPSDVDSNPDVVPIPFSTAKDLAGMLEGFPLAIVCDMNRPFQVQVTRNDRTSLYEAATVFGALTVEAWIHVRYYRKDASKKDVPLRGFWAAEPVPFANGTNNLVLKANRVYHALGIMPSPVADGQVTFDPGAVGARSMRWYLPDYNTILGAGSIMRWMVQDGMGGSQCAFPVDPQDQHPEHFLRAWNRTRQIGDAYAPSKAVFGSELVWMDVRRNPANAAYLRGTRIGPQATAGTTALIGGVALTQTFPALGKTALGNARFIVGLLSGIPFFPLAFSSPGLDGFPGGPISLNGGGNCPQSIVETLFQPGGFPTTPNGTQINPVGIYQTELSGGASVIQASKACGCENLLTIAGPIAADMSAKGASAVAPLTGQLAKLSG